MFGIGVPELVLVLIIGLVVFGPGKLPSIGRALGKSVHDFKEAEQELTQPVKEIKNITPGAEEKKETKQQG